MAAHALTEAFLPRGAPRCHQHPRCMQPCSGAGQRRVLAAPAPQLQPAQRPRHAVMPGAAAPTWRCAASAAGAAPAATSREETLTQRIFREVERRNAETQQAGGAGGGTTYEALRKVDGAWHGVKNMKTGKAAGPPPQFVEDSLWPLPWVVQYDVVVAGGTLGIFLATALQLRGHRAAVIERGPLRGRAQDWNISRAELLEVAELGLLSREEVENCISIEFNPVRCGFASPGGDGPAAEVWTRDVLNLGVSPAKLVQKVRERFEAAGGTVLERTELRGITIHPDGAALRTVPPHGSGNSSNGSGNGSNGSGNGSNGSAPKEAVVTARLVLDCTGHQSPAVRQLRHGTKPDGVCLVVGSCARGFRENESSDLIYTSTPIQGPEGALPYTQLFWEAFPAATGPTDRTTYMFTYTDADPSRPSLETMLDEYWRLMPEYQGVRLEDLEVQRIVFGLFPTYRDSPLAPEFDRLLQVGDASGIQSPLSFGGFGALTRHLARLQVAIGEALEADALDQYSLKLINAYNPALSGAWMFQRAMSCRPGQAADPHFINTLMAKNFVAMQKLGPDVLMPFLQDVVQFGALSRTMASMMASDPLFVPKIIAHVGPGPLADWLLHFMGLGTFAALARLEGALGPASRALPPKSQFMVRRMMEAWRYGAGLDYKGPEGK